MEIKTSMCYSHLLFMLFDTKLVADSIYSFEVKRPDVESEGYHGYIETLVTFQIKDLEKFVELYNKPNPNNTDWDWYHKVLGVNKC